MKAFYGHFYLANILSFVWANTNILCKFQFSAYFLENFAIFGRGKNFYLRLSIFCGLFDSFVGKSKTPQLNKLERVLETLFTASCQAVIEPSLFCVKFPFIWHRAQVQGISKKTNTSKYWSNTLLLKAIEKFNFLINKNLNNALTAEKTFLRCLLLRYLFKFLSFYQENASRTIIIFSMGTQLKVHHFSLT